MIHCLFMFFSLLMLLSLFSQLIRVACSLQIIYCPRVAPKRHSNIVLASLIPPSSLAVINVLRYFFVLPFNCPIQSINFDDNMAAAEELDCAAKEADLRRSASYRSHRAIKSPSSVHNASERPFVVPVYDPQGSILPPPHPKRRDSLLKPSRGIYPYERFPELPSPASHHFNHIYSGEMKSETDSQCPFAPKPRFVPTLSNLHIEYTHPAITPYPVKEKPTPGRKGYKRPLTTEETHDHSSSNIAEPTDHYGKLTWAHAIAAHLMMISTQSVPNPLFHQRAQTNSKNSQRIEPGKNFSSPPIPSPSPLSKHLTKNPY